MVGVLLMGARWFWWWQLQRFFLLGMIEFWGVSLLLSSWSLCGLGRTDEGWSNATETDPVHLAA